MKTYFVWSLHIVIWMGYSLVELLSKRDQLTSKIILFLVFAFTAVVVKAQQGYNYKQFGIGLDVSYERGYTNVQRQDNHIGANINFIYNF